MAATKTKERKQGTLKIPTTEYYYVRYSPTTGPLKGQTSYGVVRRYYTDPPKSKEDREVHQAALTGHLIVDDCILPVATKVAEVLCVKIDHDDEGQRAHEKAAYRAAKAIAAKAGKGVQVGKMFSIGVGDGAANYIVTAVNGAKCDVEWRGWHNGDRYTDHYFGWGRKGVSTRTVQGYIGRDEGMAALFKKEAPDFIENLPVRSIVHYDKGHGQFVRYEVVAATPTEWNDDDRDPPTKMLKPIAILGEWRDYDLPHYALDGRVVQAHEIDNIQKGELTLINPSNLYESPDYSDERKGKAKVNPATLTPLRTFPLMPTPEQEKQFAAWRAVYATKEALDDLPIETEAEFKARTKYGSRKTLEWDHNDPKACLQEAERRLTAALAVIRQQMKV